MIATAGETMRAAVLYGARDVRMEDLPLPTPERGEIVVRIHAALTCGTDLKVWRRGYHARMLRPPVPFGHELAGTVHAVGEGVPRFAKGDRVVALNSAPCDACFFCLNDQQNLCDDLLFNNGAYAEYIRIPARIVEKNTLPVPTSVPLEQAALTEPLACVLLGLEKTVARRDESLVVIGAGPIGLLMMRAAAMQGAQVVAVVKHAPQIALAKKFGAEHAVLTTDTPGTIAAVRALTPDARGADNVIECVALPQTWEWAVQMVRKGGRVNFFGGPPSGTEVALDTNLLHYSDITLKATFHHTPATTRRALALIASPEFAAGDYLTSHAPLEELPAVMHSFEQRNGNIKTVVLPDGTGERIQ